jgi:alpha-tubulin suppressor-like RCC1 family protein
VRHPLRLALCLGVWSALAAGCVDRALDGAFGASDAGGGDAAALADAAAIADGGDAGADADGPVEAATVSIPPATALLAAGGLSTCAIDAAGGAVCWGDNQHGALGSGAFTPATSAAPLPVSGLTTGVRDVAGGPFAQCAVLVDGTARCWGDSLFGDISGTTAHVQVPAPHDKTGLGNDVAQLAFGLNFACAVTTSGRGKCWGFGGAGELGSGTTADAYIAQDIAGGEALVSISPSMGGLFACAASVSGAVLCWGENGAGQLGTSDSGGHAAPLPVQGLPARATAVGAGRAHACALLEDATVACWGDDRKGQLGRGATGAAASPPVRIGVSAATSLVVGGDHACARLTSGAVTCWGVNDQGQIAAGGGGPLAPVVAVPAAFGAVVVGAGLSHTCAMSAARHVTCFGDGSRGQTGAGDFSL